MQQRDIFDAKCLKAASGEWLSAFQIAKRFGVSFQAAARAMQRLLLKGRVDSMVVKVKVKWRNGGDYKTMYRAKITESSHPWLSKVQPPEGTPRLVKGRASIRGK